MAKRITVYDPYRKINTTLATFAKNEGVPKYTVSHYYWSHRTLEGFRKRPPKGTGNGIKPHTYTHKRVYVNIQKAKRIAGMSEKTLQTYREKYSINDIDEIRRRYESDQKKRRLTHCFKTDDGRMMTPLEYAREMGVSSNAVSCWVHRKGTLKGYASRKPSRTNPIIYTHSGLGMSKSISEWAKHFKCTIQSLKMWIRYHGHDLKGFENRIKRGNPISVTYKRRTATLGEWAQRLGVSHIRIYKYYRRHKTLKGFNPNQKQGRPHKVK